MKVIIIWFFFKRRPRTDMRSAAEPKARAIDKVIQKISVTFLQFGNRASATDIQHTRSNTRKHHLKDHEAGSWNSLCTCVGF